MQKTIHDERYRLMVASLRDARKEVCLRQIDVARALGVSRAWVTKMEQCEIRLDVLQLVRLAGIYGIDAGKLIATLQSQILEDGRLDCAV